MANPPGHIAPAYTAIGRLLWRLNPSRLALAGALGLLLLTAALEASAVGMLVPLLSSLSGNAGGDPLSRLLARFVPGLDRGAMVLALAALTLGLIAAKNAVGYGFVLLGTRLRREGTVRLRSQLLHSVLHAGADAIEKRTSGELMNVFLTEGTRSSVALDYMIQLTQRSVIALGYLTAILFISWQLTLVTIVMGLCLGTIGMLLSRRLLRQGDRLAEAHSALGRRLSEVIGGLQLIRTTHGEAREERLFTVVNREQASAEAAMARTSALVSGSVETLAVATAMGLTALAHRFLLVAGALSTEQFLAFGFGLLRLLPAINQIYGLQLTVVGLSASVRPTLDFMDLPRHPRVPFGKEKLGRVSQGLELERVSYSYPGGPLALREVSFSVPAGSFLAVVGASGAGKTTLASLLLRLRAPSSGSIRIDGRDYWSFEPESYAQAIAYVEQEPFLFNASIVDNVLYGAPGASRDQAERVLALVGLDEVVARLPDGLDSVLAERGSSLSGGQRQRLAIARALVRSPQIIILDEPTSALDAETEREVVEAIERARVGRTLIVIAHRHSTIERADAVLYLNEGRVAREESRTSRVAGAS